MWLSLLMTGGCSPSVPTPAQQVNVAKDAEEQRECVANNATRADIDACRAAVKAKRAP